MSEGYSRDSKGNIVRNMKGYYSRTTRLEYKDAKNKKLVKLIK